MNEQRVRVQPDALPEPRVTRDGFIAEAYGRHRKFAITCTMI